VGVLAAAGVLATGCAAAGTSTSAPPATQRAAAAATASSAPARSAGKTRKATSCSVITQAEAGAALGGQQVRPPVRGKATVEGGVACVYYGPNVPAGFSPDVPVGDSVRVVLVTGPKAKRYFRDYRSRVRAQPVAGLGDAAFYDGFASLSVLKGDAYLRIAVAVISGSLDAEKTLAADALPRM
jgi:hypothetical protein